MNNQFNTQCTDEVIKAAISCEKAKGQPVDIDKSVDIEELRKDLDITVSDDDFVTEQIPPKRKLLIQNVKLRNTKHRMAQLAKVQAESNNTQERIVNTNKLQDRWRMDYERRAKRYQKEKAGQSVEFPKMDNPAEDKYQAYKKRRFEVTTKTKPAAQQQSVEDLMSQLAESQREVAIAKRKHREYEQHIGRLNENIQMMGRQLTQLRQMKPEMKHVQVDTMDMQSESKLLLARNEAMRQQISRLIAINADLTKKPVPHMDATIQTEALQQQQDGIRQPEAQQDLIDAISQTQQIDADNQTEPQQLDDDGTQTEAQLLIDVEMQTETQSDIQVAGQMPSFNNLSNLSNCSFNFYWR